MLIVISFQQHVCHILPSRLPLESWPILALNPTDGKFFYDIVKINITLSFIYKICLKNKAVHTEECCILLDWNKEMHGYDASFQALQQRNF